MPIDHASDHDAPCLDVCRAGIAGHNHYATSHNPPYHVIIPGAIKQLYLRRPVIERLLRINAGLKEYKLELYLFDAWRPDAIQRYFHDEWFPDWLRSRHPELNEEQIQRETELYWSAPTDFPESSPAPHLTGGAIDLTLRRTDTGQHLFMGSIFDELTAIARTDHHELHEPDSMSDREARINRRILYWAMQEQGFVNNPAEWWHYSYGDQMWARLSGARAAIFGACNPDKYQAAT